jgi:hypothetical protein
VEGHINRLKMLKRQMFGRARLDLLSCRFLLAPRRTQKPGHRLHPSGGAGTASRCISGLMSMAESKV